MSSPQNSIDELNTIVETAKLIFSFILWCIHLSVMDYQKTKNKVGFGTKWLLKSSIRHQREIIMLLFVSIQSWYILIKTNKVKKCETDESFTIRSINMHLDLNQDFMPTLRRLIWLLTHTKYEYLVRTSFFLWFCVEDI